MISLLLHRARPIIRANAKINFRNGGSASPFPSDSNIRLSIAPGLERVVAILGAVYGMIPEAETRIALETAGQGSSLGRTFEELAFILRGCREPERFCVYIDTAHLFAAGCDLDSDEGITRTFAQFKRLIWGALCNFNH